METKQALDIIKQMVQVHVDTIQGHNLVAEAIKTLEEALEKKDD